MAKLQPFLWIAVLTALLSSWGCMPRSTVTSDRDEVWLDVGAIAANVSHEAKETTVLEEEQVDKGGPQTGNEPQITVVQGAGNNPLLRTEEPVEPGPPEELRGEGVLLNFDNADIYEVIQTIAELLDINYIIDPQVKGVVNIRSGKKIPIEYLYPVFKKILQINGLDIRSEGDYQYIYVAQQHVSPFIRGPEDIKDLKESSRMITQVIPVLYLGSGEALKLIQPYLSQHGQAMDMPAQNLLLVTDFEAKVLDCVGILAKLDVSPLANLQVRTLKVENAPIFDLKEELEEMLGAMQINRQERQGVTLMVLERINSLLLMSTNRALLDTVATWVKQLDVLPREGRDNIYIYNVRNSVASELAELVNNLIAEKPSAKTPATSKLPAPGGKTSKQKGAVTTRKTTSRKATASAPSSAMQFAGEPMLLADDSRNIILIRALPPDYSRIQKLLQRLDNMPRQVLIEVLVAEINLTDEWKMGLEWYVKNQGLSVGGKRATGSFYQNAIPTTDGHTVGPDFGGAGASLAGLSYSILSDNQNVFGLLNTLATDNNLSVLSSPQVLVLNNETATVNVGDQVPIVTSESGSSTAGDLNRTIQYKDTGIILKVTPRINYDGIILIDVDQQVSNVNEQIKTDVSSPTISTKQVQTKLAVKDGQAILIGGLISRDQTTNETGVPYLKDVPILGNLFKYQEQKDAKKELLIMITPHVIESESVLDQYIQEFEARTRALRRGVYAGRGRESAAGDQAPAAP